MFKGLALICTIVLSISMLCVPVFARELEEVGETVFDTLTGNNDSAPMLASFYVAKTWEREKGPDIRAKIKYTSSIRDLTGRNSVEASFGLEF